MNGTREGRHFPPTQAVRELDLAPSLRSRLVRNLDNALMTGNRANAPLRDAIHALAGALLERGQGLGEIDARVQQLVEAHALERGWGSVGLVTGQPRFASAAARAREWVRQWGEERGLGAE